VECGPTEITKPDVVVFIQKQVFRLDISMDNVTFVKILYCDACLVKELEDFVFGKDLGFLHVVVEISVRSKLYNQVNLAFFAYVSLKLDDIWMIELLVNMDFVLQSVKVDDGRFLDIHINLERRLERNIGYKVLQS